MMLQRICCDSSLRSLRLCGDFSRRDADSAEKHFGRTGLSLLEVLTALAIFMLSVVVISQMVDTGSQTALRAKRLTRAAILCESKMAEVVAGIEPIESSGSRPLDESEPGWSYSITSTSESWTMIPIDNQEIPGLSTVHVTVVWTNSLGSDEVEHTLSRIVLDPALRVPLPEPTIGGGG